MSIPALYSNPSQNNQSFTVSQVTYSGKTFKVIAILTGIVSLVAIAAAIALQSLHLALAGVITLTVTVISACVGFKETKSSYTETKGEPLPIVIEQPRRYSSPIPASPIRGPSLDSVAAASLPAQEDIRHEIMVTPPPTPGKPPTPIPTVEPKPVESPVPKRSGLTAFFSKGAAQ